MTNTTSILDDLIETLKDGQEGFRSAAENTKSADLKALFTQFSQQRAQFVGELQGLSHAKGEAQPEDSSSIAGALHRGWINLKGALSSGSDHAILSECERGEDSAVAEYQKALDGDLSPEVRAVVQRQAAEVKKVHDQVRDLRDANA